MTMEQWLDWVLTHASESSKDVYIKRLTTVWKELILELLDNWWEKKSELIELATQHQVLLVLSLQSELVQCSSSEQWNVTNKKKRRGKFDIDSFRNNIFNK